MKIIAAIYLYYLILYQLVVEQGYLQIPPPVQLIDLMIFAQDPNRLLLAIVTPSLTVLCRPKKQLFSILALPPKTAFVEMKLKSPKALS